MRLITFSLFNAPYKPLFMLAKIPTVSDYVFKLNILLAHDTLNLASPVAVLNIQSLPDRYPTRGREFKLLKRLKNVKHRSNVSNIDNFWC